MLKITFHLFKEPTLEECYRQICALTEKYYAAKKSIFINTNSQKSAQELDDLLWIFHDVSFLPHVIYSENSNINEFPILIGVNTSQIPKTDILINLSPEMLKSINGFSEILEIVPNDENFKVKAREKYKSYKSNPKADLTINNNQNH